MTRRERKREREGRERREDWLSSASSLDAARTEQGRRRWRGGRGWLHSQRYSRKSNEREPNEAILKGDIVGSLGRRTNSITSSRNRTKSRRRRRGEREREREQDRTWLCERGKNARCTLRVHRYPETDSIAGTDRLFSGSLDYDFTGLRFQYRRR